MDLQGGPTFEDLSIDDELTQLQRLVRYSSSSIALQRLVHVKVGSAKCERGPALIFLVRRSVRRGRPWCCTLPSCPL